MRSSAQRGRRIAGWSDLPWRSIRMSLRSPTIRSIYPMSREGAGVLAARTNEPSMSGRASPASTKVATPPHCAHCPRSRNASLGSFVRMSMPADHRRRGHVDVDELLIGLEHEQREHEVQPPAVLEQPEAQRQQYGVDDQG